MSHYLSPTDPQQLLTDATTGSGIFFIGALCSRVNIGLTSDGTTSGGTITIEESPSYVPGIPYTGTWSTISASTVVSASSFTGGASRMVHITGSFWAVRVRISSTITGGGTISAEGWAN